MKSKFLRMLLALSISFTAATVLKADVPLDLRAVANMGFRDDRADDGGGGWTDQGPDNDLSMFDPGVTDFGGIAFRIIDPAGNSGKSCVVLRGAARPGFPETAEIAPQAVKRKYLYLLHAAAWPPKTPSRIGEIVVEYAGGVYVERQTGRFPVRTGREVADFWNPAALENGAVAWRGRNGQGTTVGLYLSYFELTGDPVESVSFESAGDAVWLIVGATLSDTPPAAAASPKVVFQPDADWLALPPAAAVVPGSPLDFSDLADAPAGKYGFVRPVGDRMEFTDWPGTPVRFYGANIAFGVNYMDNAAIDRMADHFAAVGYNIVRLHHFDQRLPLRQNGSSTHPDPVRLERLDYLLHAFKQRGIYITLDLYSYRTLEKGELPDWPEKKIGPSEFKALVFVNDGAMQNWQAFSRGLLEHVNSYTGVAWKEEPAIVSICLLNEDTIFSTADRTELVRAEFDRRYSEDGGGRDRNEFLAELYNAGYRQMRDFLRELGVKAMLTDQNFWSTPAVSAMRQQYDLVDNHYYWGHPTPLEKPGALPYAVLNQSMIAAGGGDLGGMFASRIYGRPFSVTEWDAVYPNQYAAEGAVLTGSYAALQGWSILCRYAYAHNVEALETAPHFYDVAADPVRLLAERVGVLLFRRGDVATVPIRAAFDLDGWDAPQFPRVLRRLGLIAGVGTGAVEQGNVDFQVSHTATGDPVAEIDKLIRQGLLPAESLGDGGQIFRSVTGELEMNRNANSFRAVTPQSEVFIQEPGMSQAGAFAKVSNRRAWSVVAVMARDGAALTRSDRLLLLHLTPVRNSGMRFRDPDLTVLEEWGDLPLLVERGESEIILNRDLTGFRVDALDMQGAVVGDVPLLVRDGKTRLRLQTDREGVPVAAYEIRRMTGR